jgi:hypothetical protein
MAGEARNSLKLGNPYVREKQETPENLEMHLFGRSKKLLKTWLYLSEPKPRTPFLR